MQATLRGIDLSDPAIVEGGWDSVVLDAGGWIFRFPRWAEVEPALRAEIALLPRLAPALPVAIPQFEYVVEEPALFVGYRKIAGVPCDGPEIARDLARFLRALHSFPAHDAPVPHYGPEAWRARHREMFGRFRDEVGPLLPPAARVVAARMFDEFLESRLDFTP